MAPHKMGETMAEAAREAHIGWDAELAALQACVAAYKTLDDDQAERVSKYLADRFPPRAALRPSQ